jgi:hypothetical protein
MVGDVGGHWWVVGDGDGDGDCDCDGDGGWWYLMGIFAFC